MTDPDFDKIDWSLRFMPVLNDLRREALVTRPLQDSRVAVVFHLSREAAAFTSVLQAAGAETVFVPSKLATVDRPLVPLLESRGVRVLAPEAESDRRAALREIVENGADILIDNADLFTLWHEEDAPPHVIGSAVHSRSASSIVERYVETGRELRYPVLKVGSSPLKLELESQYGTGQSVLNALIRVTGRQMNGLRVVVVGYGNVGAGVAECLRGANALVVVVQTPSYRALKAIYDGFEVKTLEHALANADVLLTATGGTDIVGERHLPLLRDGVFLGNIGRNSEIDIDALERNSESVRSLGQHIREYVIAGRSVYLLGRGHQFNHMVGSANSPEIMDLSLALHYFAALEFWSRRGENMAPVASSADEDITQEVVTRKLRHLGVL